MEVFNNDFNDAGGNNNENELNPEMASKLKNQLPPKKNFMSPTISASNKTTFPKKKILAEWNQTQTLDDLSSNNLDQKVVSFNVLEAMDDVEKDFVDKLSLQPYDPIKNYLSPRPKFLRYNPNRRRKIFYKNCVINSSGSFDSGSQQESLEEEMDLIDKEDDTSSCCQKESFEEVKDSIDQKGEGENDDDEDEMIEFEEDKDGGLKGFLKFLVVGFVLILMTQFICSMNSTTLYSHNLEGESGFKKGLNFSEVGDSMWESGFLVGGLKELGVYNAVESIEELGEVVSEEVELLQGFGDLDDEVENDEINVIQDVDKLQLIEVLQEDEIGEIEVMEIPNVVEGEIEVLDQEFNQESVVFDNEVEDDEIDVIQDVDKLQLIEVLQEDEIGEIEVIEIPNVEGEIEALDQEFNQESVVFDDVEIDEVETTNVLIGFVGFNLIVAVLIGVSLLVLTLFGVIQSKWMKMKKPSSHVATTTMVANENLVAEKKDIKNPIAKEPLANNSKSLVKNPMPEDVSKEVSGVHAPTVELLGEFVFGIEPTNSSFRSNDTKTETISASVGPTTVSSNQTRSSRVETSIGDSLRNTAEKTVKKPRRKIAEVTPSPVRRSSRIQNRPTIVSP